MVQLFDKPKAFMNMSFNLAIEASNAVLSFFVSARVLKKILKNILLKPN